MMNNFKKCRIRRDILSEGLSVPVGRDYVNSPGLFHYRWHGDSFMILLNEKWEDAQSVDFEF